MQSTFLSVPSWFFKIRMFFNLFLLPLVVVLLRTYNSVFMVFT